MIGFCVLQIPSEFTFTGTLLAVSAADGAVFGRMKLFLLIVHTIAAAVQFFVFSQSVIVHTKLRSRATTRCVVALVYNIM